MSSISADQNRDDGHDKEIEADKALRERILAGDKKAPDEFWNRYRSRLEAVLREDFRTTPKALRNIEDVVMETMRIYLTDRHGHESALANWAADQPLVASLILTAKRLMWHLLKRRKREVEEDTNTFSKSIVSSSSPDPKTATTAATRLAKAIRTVAPVRSRDMIIFLLKQAGVEQGFAAEKIWGLEKSALTHALNKLVECIGKELGKKLGSHLEPLIRHHFPQAWNGWPPEKAAPKGLTEEDIKELRNLAEGHSAASGDPKAAMKYSEIRDRWSQRLWQEPDAIEWLARCLKAEQLALPAIISDANAGVTRSQLNKAVHRAMSHLKPREAARLLSVSVKEMFRCVVAAARADGGTLWLLNSAKRSLEAVYNPVEPAIVGSQQSINDGGIITWVYLSATKIISQAERRSTYTKKSVLASRVVKKAVDDNDYSAIIDQSLGTQTQAMIALPFECAGELRGVLTLVKLGKNTEPFCSQDEAAAKALCDLLALSLEDAIAKLLLE